MIMLIILNAEIDVNSDVTTLEMCTLLCSVSRGNFVGVAVGVAKCDIT